LCKKGKKKSAEENILRYEVCKNNMKKTLFISLGGSPSAYYRCSLPAAELDCDWVGLLGLPDGGFVTAGNTEHEPNYDDYEVIIVQQVKGEEWDTQIKKWQAEGKKVVYEVDDFVHGVGRIEGHANRTHFGKKARQSFTKTMKLCDAMICSTQYLSDAYTKYCENQYVCLVGIDTNRYNVEFPERDGTVIGWAGGTGHHLSVGPWLEEVSKVLGVYQDVAFVSVGTNYGDALAARHPSKAISVPWTTIENYPYSLTNMDIAIAPAHVSKYYLSKSDLRWLEASALGIPTIASPLIYPQIEHESTGFLAETPEDAGDWMMELIEYKNLRENIGAQAQQYVRENRDIKQMAPQWAKAIEQITTQ
jgi:hypothetical protein